MEKIMTKEQIEKLVENYMAKNADFACEIEHKMDIAEDESWNDYSKVDALSDVIEMQSDSELRMPKVWTICKKIMVEAGMVEPVSEDTVTLGGPAHWFTMKGVKYQWA